jgi:hypothetical protein
VRARRAWHMTRAPPAFEPLRPATGTPAPTPTARCPARTMLGALVEYRRGHSEFETPSGAAWLGCSPQGPRAGAMALPAGGAEAQDKGAQRARRPSESTYNHRSVGDPRFEARGYSS